MSWGASTDAVGVTGYLISRCSGAGCTSFTQIASVSGTTLSYSNTGLSSATSYSYEVRATDAAGLYSGYSPIGSATTPTGSGVSGSVSYGYDALGRLIQVASPTLSSVEELSYDAAGNISSNASNVITALKVANLSVDQAAAGEQITIDGSGFSATASADTVTINGVAATVTSASTTQLVVTVPSGATTGVVKVTVGGVAVSSTQSLSIVPAGAAPTIASFSPTEGAPGTSVSITGTNFATTSADDKVLFNDAPALVTAATATKLTVTVPVDAAPGPIQVITPTGSATSASDFIAPPSGYTTSNIGSSGTIVEGGAAVAVSLSAGKIALELFTGTVGDWLTLGVSGLTVSSATLIVYSPLGLPIATSSITANGQSLQIPQLQSTGVYTIVVDPGANTGAVTLTLFKPKVGTLTAGGASVTLALTPAGERGLVSFSGTSGQYLALDLSGNTVASATVSIYEPNGGLLLSQTVTPSTAGIELPQLTLAGTYTVLVNPGSASGNVTLSLLAPATASVTVAGPTVNLTLGAGQRALVTFSGTVGQYLTIVPGFVGTLKVSSPTGAVIFPATVIDSLPFSTTPIQLPGLPVTGTYTIFADPGASSSDLSLAILLPVTGNTSTFPSSLNLSNPLTRGLLTFTGAPGQYIALTVQENGQSSPTGDEVNLVSGIQITIVAPDGSILNGTSVMGPALGVENEPSYSFSCATGTCYGNSIINLGPLPSYSQGTTFTALIQQTGGSGGVFSYSITNPIVSSQTLTVSNSPTSYYLANPGQGILIPIALQANQNYELTISEQPGNFPALQASVIDGYGGTTLVATCSSSCQLGAVAQYTGTSPSDSVSASAAGPYTLLIQQLTQISGPNAYGPLAGDFELQLTLNNP